MSLRSPGYAFFSNPQDGDGPGSRPWHRLPHASSCENEGHTQYQLHRASADLTLEAAAGDRPDRSLSLTREARVSHRRMRGLRTIGPHDA